MQGVEKLKLVDRPGGAMLAVKAAPGGRRNCIVGVLGDRLKVAVSAAPEKGKANAAIAEVLASALGLPTSAVRLLSSPANPRKDFFIAGLSAEQLRKKLAEM